MKDLENKGFSTKAIHAGEIKDEFGALAVPIYQTSTYIFDNAAQGGRRFALEEDGYIYSRLGNPTTGSLETTMAALEKGESAVATSSGMGAITSAIWPFIKKGDHIIASDTLYGCTHALLAEAIPEFGVEVEFIDTSDYKNVENALKDNTKIVYLETPANPTLNICDIEEIAKAAHKNEGVRVIVDNTFATPYLQNPLTLGADIVVHSATKYLNGHGDVIAGVVVGKANDMAQVRLKGLKDMTGSVLSPHDAFLVLRGIKTLALRMDRHCENALKVVDFLKDHKAITKIYFPGLSSHHNHDVCKKQMKKPGGMVAFEVDTLENGMKVLDSVQMIKLAVSLGDSETLIEHPASMTHSTYSKEELKEAGIPEGLIRLSVGLEDSDDIIADLKQALDQIN